MGLIVPLVYVCSSCGRPLEIFVGNGSRGPPSFQEVVSKHGYRCPYCGAELVLDPMKTKIRIAPVKDVRKKIGTGRYDKRLEAVLKEALAELDRYIQSKRIRRKIKK
ncbi:hypothetical protein IPA_06145 [Ignicoccus pacificus DSM 13166]|uniref:Uncharacterized protein n=1 Tax=Ignicoccus pacificus DSM 13166 TaxID=940294 RepID=A0A977KCU0_9CREN|nr:hypothetical protein IPA_06145 [Ignicoccus pacificus DSM 13166]